MNYKQLILTANFEIFYHRSAAMPQKNRFVIEQKQDPYRTSFQQHPKSRDDFVYLIEQVHY